MSVEAEPDIQQKPKRPMGNPPMPFDQAVADYICERFATEPISLKTIVDQGKAEFEQFPGVTTVYRWLDENPSFAKNYARGKDAQADLMAEDVVEIADDGRNDYMERLNFDGANKGWEINGEAVARSRVRIDARKWMAAHLKPKKYGDKLDIDQTLGVSTDLAALLNRTAITGQRLIASDVEEKDE